MTVTDDLHRLVRLTQRRVIVRTVVIVTLGFACLGVAAWRLGITTQSRPWVLAVVGLGGIGVIAWQLWRCRRDWLSLDEPLVKLDHALGLQARLVTAAEFADQPNPPALYETLARETAQAMPEIQRRLPRVADHRTGLLLIALAILLLWPNSRVGLLPLIPPSTPSVPPTPPEEVPSPPEPQSGDQQQQSGGSSAGSQGQPQQQEQGSSSKASSQNQQQADASSKAQSDPSKASQQAKEQAAQQRDASSSKSSSESKGDASQQRGQSAQNETGGQRGDSGRQESQGMGQGQDQQQAASQQKPGGSQAGAASSLGQGQELTKADIQRLLKEVSGELKALQAQLEAQQQDLPQPTAGTSTDPELYEQAAPLEPSKGSTMPIQLEVDPQASAAARRGGGVGQPSGEVASDGPQQQPEEVTLAAHGEEESGVDRQRIPPEYQPVFDQLTTRATQ